MNLTFIQSLEFVFFRFVKLQYTKCTSIKEVPTFHNETGISLPEIKSFYNLKFQSNKTYFQK